MSPDAALLIQVGTALYGPSWQAPVAAVLGRTPQSVSNMAAGRQGIRPEYWAALLAHIPVRLAEMRAAKAALRDAA